MALSSGTRIGSFEIDSLLGAGGMGRVYRARDVKLGREVALKLILENGAWGEERLSRFEREARILAALNHPGIATLHGLESSEEGPLLVMELVEGETLAHRLSRGSLSIEEALPLFRQIAEALEFAHAKGILHRDLKPSNVMVTPEGRVKLLDFGLAKAFLDETKETSASHSPTLTRGTAHGEILGTASYMSPEQARGQTVDRRADIWAFGAVLYEALSGRKAFDAETVTDTLAAIVRGEPDFSALPRGTPSRLRELLARCLRKDASHRLQHIGDARIVLEESGLEPETPASPKRRSGWLVPLGAAAAAAALTWLGMRTDVALAPVIRTTLDLAPGTTLYRSSTPSIAISPDGRTIAYVALRDGRTHIYLRVLDDLEGKPVAGTEGAAMPFFSADNRWLGFYLIGRLMKVPLSGGAAALIARPHGVDLRGASWGDDGKVVFPDHNAAGLWEVDAGGGEPVPLTQTDPGRREKSHRLPEALPGSRAVLFTLGTGDIGTWDEASVAVLSRDTGTYRVLVEGGSNPRYAESGHLLYAHDGAVLAVPFDEGSLSVRGTPVKVVDGVATSPIYGGAEFAISREGTLVYARGPAWGYRHRVVWIDPDGSVEPLLGEERPYIEAILSPDDRSLALGIEGANATLWIYDLSRGTLTRAAAGFDSLHASWSPGGDRVAFTSNRAGPYQIYEQSVGGSGAADLLVRNETNLFSPQWSPDGEVLTYVDGGDLWMVVPESGERTQLLGGDFLEWQAEFSPDGRWLAYSSDESGQFQIYLRAFPDVGRKWQVSTTGGSEPRFQRDGRRLFYREGAKLMAVGVDLREEPILGKPAVLFERPYAPGTSYDVAGDGRFLWIEDAATEPPPSELVLVQNFFSVLETVVPAR
jgi:serine/threonine-protein kinase